MSDSRPRVTLQGAQTGTPGLYLQYVYDPATGTYYKPEADSNGPEAQLQQQGATGKGAVTAIIDSGVLLAHPTISNALQQNVDFTGEGPNDLNGHGTMVALIFLMTAPGAKILNVKAVGASGEGDWQQLIDAVDWCTDWCRNAGQILVVNMSCGCYTPNCRGDCPLCAATAELSRAGALVFVAAGNQAGDTVCPAKLSVFQPGSNVIAVGAYDVDKGEIAPYSGNVGPGGILGGVGKHRFVPAK
jgi:subtilase-type proteinase RRT12